MTTKNNGIYAPDGSQYVTLTDGANTLAGLAIGGLPAGATATQASSGNVANASAAATLTGVAAKTMYLSGIMITGGGATAAALVNATITGLLGGTATLTVGAVAGATLANTPILIDFSPALPASAVNTSIVLTVPALGAGNTNSAVTAYGYVL